MKILQFKAENIKRLVVVEITPDGNIIQITGRNGSGKSSTIDAIWYCLGGADNIPKRPIRMGQDKGYIRLDLGELIVERTFTAKGSYLKVTNADGLSFQSPQKVLDKLVGALSFDPLAFMRMRPADQISQLQNLTGVNGAAVAEANKTDYEARRDINRDAKAARARADAITVPDDAPTVEVDLSELREKIENAERQNAVIQTAIESRDALYERIRKGKDLIEDLQKQHDEFAKLAKGDEKPTDEMKLEVDAEVLANEAMRNKANRDENVVLAESYEVVAGEFTNAMETRTKAFEAEMAKAELPIDGLTIDLELGVMFNGVPLEQAGTAEQVRVSTALAMAANPKIKVLRIRDGSLLDEDSLALIAGMAEDEDYQIWVESVDTSGKVGIMLEDGMVAQQEGES